MRAIGGIVPHKTKIHEILKRFIGGYRGEYLKEVGITGR
jgi:hypothetical protein